MQKEQNILLICGGGGSEHNISLLSADYIESELKKIDKLKLHRVEIKKDGTRIYKDGRSCELRRSGDLIIEDEKIELNFAIPCIHGPPGESGEIQSVFEMMNLPYLGSAPEASRLCFNKVTTKLWLDALKVPNTKFHFLKIGDDQTIAEELFDKWDSLFIKASSQGSSIGCYLIKEKNKLTTAIHEALKLSPFVLLEKPIIGRELEVAAYVSNGQLKITDPGEICCPTGVYSFEEKYNSSSQTTTKVKASLKEESKIKIKKIAKEVFEGLNLKHLARIDFFLTQEEEILVNEVNTFPGMTPISMFPKMLEENADSFKSFLKDIITKEAR